MIYNSHRDNIGSRADAGYTLDAEVFQATQVYPPCMDLYKAAATTQQTSNLTSYKSSSELLKYFQIIITALIEDAPGPGCNYVLIL